jgi:hypothetical protein
MGMDNELGRLLKRLRYKTDYKNIHRVNSELDMVIDIVRKNDLNLIEIKNDLGETFDEKVALETKLKEATNLLECVAEEGYSEMTKNTEEFLYKIGIYTK